MKKTWEVMLVVLSLWMLIGCGNSTQITSGNLSGETRVSSQLETEKGIQGASAQNETKTEIDCPQPRE